MDLLFGIKTEIYMRKDRGLSNTSLTLSNTDIGTNVVNIKEIDFTDKGKNT
jgi:hypothetical protein